MGQQKVWLLSNLLHCKHAFLAHPGGNIFFEIAFDRMRSKVLEIVSVVFWMAPNQKNHMVAGKTSELGLSKEIISHINRIRKKSYATTGERTIKHQPVTQRMQLLTVVSCLCLFSSLPS